MLFLVSCLLALDGSWFSLSDGGTVYLRDDPIAFELGLTFDFDRISWTGPLERGIPSGKGRLRCFVRDELVLSYKGNMVEGAMSDPKGVYIVFGREMKWKYQGHLVAGQREGKGRMEWVQRDQTFSPSNAIVYNGDWQNNDFNGQGTYVEYWKRYEGGFKNGRYHGSGRLFEFAPNLAAQPAEFRGVNKDGKPVRLVREGQWVNGTYVGKSTKPKK